VYKKVGRFIPRMENFIEIRISQKFNANVRNAQFQSKLDNLLDTVNANALDLMYIKEDGAFLIAQRQKSRIGSLLSIDHKMIKKKNPKKTTDK